MNDFTFGIRKGAKACPFCGSRPISRHGISYCGGDSHNTKFCAMYGKGVSDKEWDNRAILWNILIEIKVLLWKLFPSLIHWGK